MLIYAIAAVGGVGILLLTLKLWASVKARPRTTTTGIVYETQASRIDAHVEAATHWLPHLRVMPLFWVCCLGTFVVLCLDFHFGWSQGGLMGLFVLGSMFAIADLAIPFIALRDATDDGRRSVIGMILLLVCTVMSFMVVIGSTADINAMTGARAEVTTSSFKDTQKLLTIKQQERDSIPVDRGAQALNDLAKSTEEAAAREGGRVRCGDKCEELKKQAADYRARAKEAERKEKLTGEIEQIKVKLTGGSASEQRTEVNAMATVLEGMSLGYISQNGFRTYGLTVFGLVMVTVLTLLWAYVGMELDRKITAELLRRHEIADEARRTLGLTAKYTAQPAQALLAPPTPAVDPTMVFNVQAADMRKRYANDEQLAETMALFDTLLMRGEGGRVKIADLYRAYQVQVLSAEPNARYMTQPTMASKLTTISQEMDGIRLTADGVLEGWVLKPLAERKMESANAA